MTGWNGDAATERIETELLTDEAGQFGVLEW